MNIEQINTNQEILNCFQIMKQLVTSVEEKGFIKQIRRKEKKGYMLYALKMDGLVVSIIGIRIYEYFGCGKFLVIDDLVTNEEHRNKGYGKLLFQWALEYAKKIKCNEIQLDSSIDLFKAHKFYFNMGMKITNYHFTLNIKNKSNEQK